jgi:hypothetical protein
MTDTDTVFAGSVPELYETHLVPLIFEPCAADLKNRVAAMDASRYWRSEATDVAATAIARRFRTHSVDGKIQAHKCSMSWVATPVHTHLRREALWRAALAR